MKKIRGLNKALGRRLQHARKVVHPAVTQDMVAAHMDTDRAYVSRIEAGQTLPSLNSLMLYAQAVQTSASELIRQTEQDLKKTSEPGGLET